MSGDTSGHGQTNVRDMSGTATDVMREYLDFTKHQLEFEQRRNDRLERALEEMREDIKRTQEQLSRLLPIAKSVRTDKTTGGHGRTCPDEKGDKCPDTQPVEILEKTEISGVSCHDRQRTRGVTTRVTCPDICPVMSHMERDRCSRAILSWKLNRNISEKPIGEETIHIRTTNR